MRRWRLCGNGCWFDADAGDGDGDGAADAGAGATRKRKRKPTLKAAAAALGLGSQGRPVPYRKPKPKPKPLPKPAQAKIQFQTQEGTSRRHRGSGGGGGTDKHERERGVPAGGLEASMADLRSMIAETINAARRCDARGCERAYADWRAATRMRIAASATHSYGARRQVENGSADRIAEILLCDAPACNREFHMSCLDPPLAAVPRAIGSSALQRNPRSGRHPSRSRFWRGRGCGREQRHACVRNSHDVHARIPYSVFTY